MSFEALLADLSANFVNVPATQVDDQILVGLRRIVEFLGIDRSGFGQLLPGGYAIAITHSYQVDGVSPTPKVVLESQFPIYARMIHEGTPFRLPEDIQDFPEAAAEREYLSKSGLQSQLTIPLKVAGAVVGGMKGKRLLLADRHLGVLGGAHGLLHDLFDSVAMVADERSLVEAVTDLRPDRIIMDLSLSEGEEADLAERMLALNPALRSRGSFRRCVLGRERRAAFPAESTVSHLLRRTASTKIASSFCRSIPNRGRVMAIRMR